MANHCYELLCPQCGKSWCERGCGFGDEPNEEDTKKFQQSIKDGKHKVTYLSGCKCSNCGCENLVRL